MGEMIDYFRDARAHKRLVRAKYGLPCPACREKHPRRQPTILLPQQRCKVDGYTDQRPELTAEQFQDVGE